MSGAVHRLVDRFGAETGLPVHVDLDASIDGLRRDRQVVLLRSTQEALANVRRHAAARQVVVRLGANAHGAAVDIVDDGAGFDAGRQQGFGLAGMRRRVEQVGGSVDVDSAPGRGTRVRVRIPLADAAAPLPASFTPTTRSPSTPAAPEAAS